MVDFFCFGVRLTLLLVLVLGYQRSFPSVAITIAESVDGEEEGEFPESWRCGRSGRGRECVFECGGDGMASSVAEFVCYCEEMG